MTMPNTYSTDWFDIFLDTYPATFTLAEVNFIQLFLPQDSYQHILDICCGTGRHAHRLAEANYKVTGIDINADVIQQAQAKEQANTSFLVHDMRALKMLPQTYDAAINMWQSFGYFDEATNASILNALHSKLNARGRFIIDMYNRDFFEKNIGEKQFERAGKKITERKTLNGNQLRVELDYEDKANADVFSWQVYSLSEFQALASDCGFTTLVSCTHANVNIAPSADYPRMQLVVEKKS